MQMEERARARAPARLSAGIATIAAGVPTFD